MVYFCYVLDCSRQDLACTGRIEREEKGEGGRAFWSCWACSFQVVLLERGVEVGESQAPELHLASRCVSANWRIQVYQQLLQCFHRRFKRNFLSKTPRYVHFQVCKNSVKLRNKNPNKSKINTNMANVIHQDTCRRHHDICRHDAYYPALVSEG